MTVRDLYRVLTLSPKSIEVQFYDEQHNEYDSLCGIEEYEVLYIKDWQAGTYEPTEPVALEQCNPFKSYLRLSVVIVHQKPKNLKCVLSVEIDQKDLELIKMAELI